MTKLRTTLPILLFPLAMLTSDCSATKQDARDALDVTDAVLDKRQIACLLASEITDAPALAKACRIADTIIPILLPTIRGLIGVREGAKRAGVRWSVETDDAGVADAAAK